MKAATKGASRPVDYQQGRVFYRTLAEILQDNPPGETGNPCEVGSLRYAGAAIKNWAMVPA